MRSQQLKSLEVPSTFWKALPLECSANTRLEREFNRVSAKVKRSVEAFSLEKYLCISKACVSDCSQVFR